MGKGVTPGPGQPRGSIDNIAVVLVGGEESTGKGDGFMLNRGIPAEQVQGIIMASLGIMLLLILAWLSCSLALLRSSSILLIHHLSILNLKEEFADENFV